MRKQTWGGVEKDECMINDGATHDTAEINMQEIFQVWKVLMFQIRKLTGWLLGRNGLPNKMSVDMLAKPARRINTTRLQAPLISRSLSSRCCEPVMSQQSSVKSNCWCVKKHSIWREYIFITASARCFKLKPHYTAEGTFRFSTRRKTYKFLWSQAKSRI